MSDLHNNFVPVIKLLTKNDLMITSRVFGLYSCVINLIILISISRAFWKISTYLIYFPVVLVMLSFNELFLNIFSRTKNDIFIYNSFPICLIDLFIARNAATIFIVALFTVAMDVVLIILSNLSPQAIIDAIYYHICLLTTILLYGNFYSVIIKIIQNKGKSVNWLHNLAIQLIVLISILLYLITKRMIFTQFLILELFLILIYFLQIWWLKKNISRYKFLLFI
ncbi:hypothetical protein DRQ07_12055 [candidate division KSB1 bacterium]|nr:MAG: hypothetical protein DRQ07_12055 [candidate division KSB1 bacterium]